VNKAMRTLAILFLTLGLSPAYSEDPAGKPGAAQVQSEAARMSAQMQQMQENMKTMQELMAKIRASSDPNERRKLMQEHMQAMHAQMAMMHDMGRGMMMGMTDQGGATGCTPESSMTNGPGGKMGPEMMQRHRMMLQRMDMMQMMMEQMLQREEAMGAAKPNK